MLTQKKTLSVMLSILLGVGIFNLDNAEARSVSPFPASLSNISAFRGQNNVSYYFYITGSKSGSVWGTNIYTDDSNLAAAVVHAGLLKDGETGVVKVTTLPGQSQYTGSNANGVNSSSYSNFQGSYSLAADDGGDNPVIAAPGDLRSFRGYPGDTYLFSLTAKADAGSLWGNNVYTDDSNLTAAAVYAGALSNGAKGVVRVVIVPGQDRYISGSHNGINTNSYAVYPGSYALSNVTGDIPLIPLLGSPENPIDNSGGLSNFRAYLGGAYYFKVKGAKIGSIWGSNPYTDDSSLATAAVHAGLLQDAQTGVLKATIQAGLSQYIGTTANGVNSNNYSNFSGSYTLAAADGSLGSIPAITSPLQANYSVGQAFSYQIVATNTAKKYNATGLPKGLSVNTDTGLISGTPILTGRFAIDLQAINDSGTSSKTLVLNSGAISTPVTPTPTPSTPQASNTADCLLNWAEAHFPELFSPANRPTEQGFGYQYRFYSATNTYLGILLGDKVHLLQLNKSTTPVEVGSVAQFKPLSGCN